MAITIQWFAPQDRAIDKSEEQYLLELYLTVDDVEQDNVSSDSVHKCKKSYLYEFKGVFSKK